MNSKQIESLKSAIACGIKPEVRLTREHHEMIEAIAQVWDMNSAIARKLERAFVAICNGETHEGQ